MKPIIKSVRQFGRYELVGPVRLPLALKDGQVAEFQIWYFSFPGGQYAALVKGKPSRVNQPLVRLESVCIWAHLFGSQSCDCGWQMEEAKMRICREGVGLVIFAFDEHGKGIGIRNHFLVYAEGQRRKQELVSQAYRGLGLDVDYRHSHRDVADILRHFGINHIRLMSNNPDRLKGLRRAGIRVRRVPLRAPVNSLNKAELRAKKKLGQML